MNKKHKATMSARSNGNFTHGLNDWIEDDLNEGRQSKEDSNEQQQQQNEPGKITQRRRSHRILERTERDSQMLNDDDDDDEKPPPPKKKRGRPKKITNTQDDGGRGGLNQQQNMIGKLFEFLPIVLNSSVNLNVFNVFLFHLFDTEETRSRSTSGTRSRSAGARIGIADARREVQSVLVVLDRNNVDKYYATNDLGEGYYTVSAPKPKQKREENAVDVVIQVRTSSEEFLQTENACMWNFNSP